MNIKMPGLLQQNPYDLKSTEDRLQRQGKRDEKIQFFEYQKEKLKEMTSTDLSDIARKLELLHNYDGQIAAAKKEFNNSQVFKVLDEAQERAEQIKENAEKTAPKTPEERRKEAIEEATGVEMPDGLLSEMMDEIEAVTESMEETLESTEELAECADKLEKFQNKEESTAEMLSSNGQAITLDQKELLDKYRPVDYHV